MSAFIWAILDVLLWGFISKYLSSFGGATFSFATVTFGAIILWDFTSRIQQGIMTAFLEDIWSQNFINFFASPLKLPEYIAGMILSSIMTGVIGLGLMAGIAGLLFGYNIFKIGLLIALFLFILFVFGVAIGIMISALIFRYGPAAEWVSWPIPFVLSMLSGVFYPVSTLPSLLVIFAKIIPSSYVFEGIKSTLATGSLSEANAINIFIGGILSVAYLFFAYWIFIRVYQRNLKTGALARFSAENY